MTTLPTLLAVPNVSEGGDTEAIKLIGAAFTEDTPDVRLLDTHSDLDHHRSVYTLAGPPARLSTALINGAKEALARIDLRYHEGEHPRVGVLDVAPIVYLRQEDQGVACAEAFVLADRLGDELDLPVFLYGALADGRTRAEIRRLGLAGLDGRMQSGELLPDFGPARLHPTAGAVLVAARAPLIAFNVELQAPATLEDAKRIAAAIREGGDEGLPSLRALGLWLTRRKVAQVSMNIEDHDAVPLARIIEAIARHADPARAEVVGLAPRRVLDAFPENIPLELTSTIEDVLGNSGPENV